MIGNDVVDLHLAKLQSNWRRPRYLSKIFTQKEQSHIIFSENKTQMVWQLWSMKEAAYKAHQRHFELAPKFNPKAFECNLLSAEKGSVFIDGSRYDTRTTLEKEYIYSEAITSNFNLSSTSIFMKNTSSEALKMKMMRAYSKQLDHPLSAFVIRKCNHGIPRLVFNQKQLSKAFSLTHHGKYSAFIIVKDSN